MKNLNRTTEQATMPKLNAVTPVNRSFLYSLCAVLCLLTCSSSTKAESGYRSMFRYGHRFFFYGMQTSDNSGKDMNNPYLLPVTLGFSGSNVTTYSGLAAQTGSSPFVNNYGDPTHSGNDEYIQITVADDGYLGIHGGTSDFDSIFYVFDSSWNLITSGDDGDGSGWGGHSYLQPAIQYYVSAGTYYLIVDGTDKYGAPKSGDVGLYFSLQ